MKSIDYNGIAKDYARHRRCYPGLVEHILERAQLAADSVVVEVGCGTANHLAAIKLMTCARCIGIDPSVEMLDVAAAQPAELELRVGVAEKISELEGPFDLIFSVDVIHYVREPESYFSEVFQVLKPGGMLCTVTESEYVIRNRQPMSAYFPATVAVDLNRMHRIPALLEKLATAGFTRLDEVLIESSYEVTESARFEERAYSSLHLIPDEDFERGTAALRADLARSPLPGVLRSSVLWGRRPA